MAGYNSLTTEEIEEARLTLQLPQTALRLLPDEEADVVFRRAEAHFVASRNRRWWWEDFRLPSTSVHFQAGNGFEFLTQIVPSSTETVWWIVEEDTLSTFPVYEAKVETIEQVIGACYPFEYYLVATDLRWLVGENHHDVVFAIGEEVKARLKQIGDRLSHPEP